MPEKYYYVTDEDYDTIKNWNYKDGYNRLMDYIKERWAYENWGWDKRKDIKSGKVFYDIATGGWSENECLMSALQENRIFWGTCWEASRRGGAYLFSVKEEA